MGGVSVVSTVVGVTADDRARPKWQQVLDDLEDRLASGDIDQRLSLIHI